MMTRKYFSNSYFLVVSAFCWHIDDYSKLNDYSVCATLWLHLVANI